MKTLLLFFFMALLGLAHAVSAQPLPEASVAELAPVVVEGVRETPSIPHAQPVLVPTGVGAKLIDRSTNELGAETQTMERDDDIANFRRVDPWWLPPSRTQENWQTLLHADASADQKIKARVSGNISNPWRLLASDFEGGWSQDHRDLLLWSNRGNPYDASQAQIEHVTNRRDAGYARAAVHAGDLKLVGDYDSRSEDLHAGDLLTGVNQVQQASFGGRWQAAQWTVIPSIQNRRANYEATFNPLLSNSTNDNLAQTRVLYAFEQTEASLVTDGEALDRRLADHSQISFKRLNTHALLTQSPTLSWADFKLHLGSEFAQDETTGNSLNGTQSNFMWDAGGEISSPHRYSFGAAIAARRFSLLPTPSQQFGDGALLLGAGNLPPESGLRLAAGPWFKTDTWDAGVTAFSEHDQNAPVMVAVSPASVRTLAIGGVWSEGLEGHLAWQRGRWHLRGDYTMQTALNDSAITWQRGNGIPGRPRHVAGTDFSYGHRRWKNGLRYEYRSADNADLSGLWFRPPHHDLDVFVAYATSTWTVRLAANRLLSELNGLPSAQFAGQAAPDLIQPVIEQMEIRLQCELLM